MDLATEAFTTTRKKGSVSTAKNSKNIAHNAQRTTHNGLAVQGCVQKERTPFTRLALINPLLLLHHRTKALRSSQSRAKARTRRNNILQYNAKSPHPMEPEKGPPFPSSRRTPRQPPPFHNNRLPQHRDHRNWFSFSVAAFFLS